MSGECLQEVELNDEQLEVVEAPADARLLVIAGAGQGKTEVVVSRIRSLVQNEGWCPPMRCSSSASPAPPCQQSEHVWTCGMSPRPTYAHSILSQVCCSWERVSSPRAASTRAFVVRHRC